MAVLLALVLGVRVAFTAARADDVNNPLRGEKIIAQERDAETGVRPDSVISDLGLRLQLMISSPENRVWQSMALRRLAFLWAGESVAPKAEPMQGDGRIAMRNSANRYERDRGNTGYGGGKQGVIGTTEFGLWLPIIPGEGPG